MRDENSITLAVFFDERSSNASLVFAMINREVVPDKNETDR